MSSVACRFTSFRNRSSSSLSRALNTPVSPDSLHRRGVRRATRDGTASTSTYLWEDRGVVCGILVDRGVLRGVCSVLRFPPPKDIAALEFGGRRAVLVARQEAVVAMYPPRDIVLVSLVMQRNRWSREVGASTWTSWTCHVDPGAVLGFPRNPEQTS